MNMEKVRTIKLFIDYYKEFFVAQTKTIRDKINFLLKLVEMQRIIPKKFFRFIEDSDGIYEIRIEIESGIYRICEYMSNRFFFTSLSIHSM